ncbi:hypothetical protein PV08_06159 [Exophiala spinifera]|uniref:Uncharacterized protein n=1 Tax=Exophiala spinifera TaxID=91928 RepID=A0A0D2BAV9_9EURO|nr:uncharacterized protein PV08_06159 [Exophiala spinifera]KIW16108.1 hypothetical protein PV08_06159 [Exophiala spinifera]
MIHPGLWSRHNHKTSALRQQQQPRIDEGVFVEIPTSTRNIGTVFFLNFTAEHFRDGSLPQALEDDVPEPESYDSIGASVDEVLDDGEILRLTGVAPPLSLMPAHSSYQGVNTNLLSYYIHVLSPQCSLSETDNPYLNVLLPVAYEFEPLRDALLAAAANHLRLHDDLRFERHALELKTAAIKGLRNHLRTNDMDWQSLATTLMFCFYDISDGCAPSWITHLKMGLQMLTYLTTRTSVDDSLKAFCEIYFVAHEVMGGTAWTGWSNSDGDSFALARSEEIDPLMGCSRELISIVGQISSLARRVQTSTDPSSIIESTEFLTMRNDLVSRLRRLRQCVPSSCVDQPLLMQIAEVKRLAAMLYLEERVPRPTDTSSVDNCIPPPRSLGRKRLIDCIMSSLRLLPETCAASLWPLFVLGNSRLESEEQRHFVLTRLGQLEDSRKLGSIYHARRLVERYIAASSLPSNPLVLGNLPRGLALTENERWISLA